MLDFLPKRVKEAIERLNSNGLFELRLRAYCPVTINYNKKYVYLSDYGVVTRADRAIVLTEKEVADCVFAASDYSVYSVAAEMRECFLTTKSGIRLGVCGTAVRDGEKTIAMRDITSVCVRIPHPVQGCADRIFQLCEREKLCNCILLSLPGMGKTTALRELARLISINYPSKNILIVDERGEISAFPVGNADILKFARKEEAFSFGIRSMRPDVVVTDELQEEDYSVLQKAIYCGLKVIASAHFGGEIGEFTHKIFERYVCFDREEIGKIAGIYDENMTILQ